MNQKSAERERRAYAKRMQCISSDVLCWQVLRRGTSIANQACHISVRRDSTIFRGIGGESLRRTIFDDFVRRHVSFRGERTRRSSGIAVGEAGERSVI